MRLLKDPLPDRNPLLLLVGRIGEFLGLAEGRLQDLAQTGAKEFQRQHGFPVADGEADAVGVDGDDAGVHLKQVLIFARSVCILKVRKSLAMAYGPMPGSGMIHKGE